MAADELTDDAGAAPVAAGASPSDSPADEADEVDPWAAPRDDDDPPPRRNPPRDWAAPPPWAAGGAAANASTARPPGDGERPPDFLASRSASQGLAGSAADRLAGGQPAVPPAATASSPASDDLAGLVASVGVAAGIAAGSGGSSGSGAARPPLTRPPSGAYPTTAVAGRRPTVSSTRDRSRSSDHDGPSWESARRYEAFPTIKTRAGLPGIPRVAVWAGAIGIAALTLFFLRRCSGSAAARSRAPAHRRRPGRPPRRPRRRSRSRRPRPTRSSPATP